jgi:hypothetical protein
MAKQEESVQVSTPAPYAMLQRRYAKAPEFVSRRIADEMLLLPIRQNLGDLESIYTLNEVAARVWELLDGQRTVAEIRDLVVAEFVVSAETAEVDLTELLAQLTDIEAVTTRDDHQSLTERGQA